MLPPAAGAAMIVVFGSINIDLVVPVPRLPAPGETVLGEDYVVAPGGKGANQALAARRAGAAVTMVGAVGRDAFAETALALLRRDGVELSLVAATDRPTGCATITVDAAGENQIAVASGANRLAAAAQVPERLLGPGTVLVLQREVPMAENAKLIARARAHGARIVLSLAPAGPIDPARLDDIDILIANEREAAVLGDAPEALARSLRQALVVTRGAAGAVVLRADGGRLAVAAPKIDAVDTTGAGDTFAGVLAASLDSGHDLGQAIERATIAASLACLALGAQTAMPSRQAIESALRSVS